MEMSWLEGLIFGFISGLTEFLPISPQAHSALFLKLTGSTEGALTRLTIHLGVLTALLIACAPVLSRLNRERRIAAIPKNRRKRQPDMKSLLEIRVLKTAAVSLLVSFLAWPLVHNLHERLWVLALFMAVNGMVLYVPQFLPGANKDARSLSAVDAFLIGLGAGAGVIPGISRIGTAVSTGLVRGTERRYALDIALLLCIPALIVTLFIDLIGMFSGLGGISLIRILTSIFAGAAAFGGATVGIFSMRFLSFKTGFSGFAYYCWGIALFAFILYLTI